MDEASKVAIARVVIRSKESLVALRPRDGVLAMETMLFADEVINPDSLDELTVDGGKTSKRELDMAKQLIESLAADFEPEAYRDEYRERVLELIERKAAGETITIEAPEEADQGAGPDGGPGGLDRGLERPERGGSSARARRAAARPSPPAKTAAKKWWRGGSRSRSRAGGSLSNLDKVMYPDTGFTKGQVIDYYIAPAVPTPARPPLTLKRYPNGVEGPVLLREELPVARARVGPQGARRRDRLLHLRRPADARLARQPGGPGAAPVAVAGG